MFNLYTRLFVVLSLLAGIATPATTARPEGLPPLDNALELAEGAQPVSLTRYVAKTGADSGDCVSPAAPCASLQYAIDRAQTGDSVLVATGVYTDVNSYGGLAQAAYISETLTLRGGYSPDFTQWNPAVYTTTLDVQGQGRALYISGAITPIIEAFTLTGADSNGLGGGGGSGIGGAVSVITATAVISGCEIFGNNAYGGAGIGVYQGNAHVVGSNIHHNHATSAAGVAIISGNATFTNNVLAENDSDGSSTFFMLNSAITLTHNTILSNTITSNTGSEYTIYLQSATPVFVDYNTIRGNDGVGLFVQDNAVVTHNTIEKQAKAGIGLWFSHNILISNNVIAGNLGGGVSGYAYSGQITGNTIRGNSTAYDGGGIYLQNIGVEPFILSQNTIISNTAGRDGGGIYLSGSGPMTVTDNTIRSNRASGHGGGMFIAIAPMVIEQNSISENICDGSGGGIFITDSSGQIRENMLRENIAGFGAGGMLADSHLPLSIENNQFIGNRGDDGGGGAFAGGASFNLVNNSFIGNQATNGGGLLINGITVENVVVSKNQVVGSNGKGSGIYVYGSSENQIRHATILQNTGGDESGIFVTPTPIGSLTLVITNTILVSQTIGITATAGTTVLLDSTLWYGNGQNWAGAGNITATHSITGNPAFLKPAMDNYRLSAASPAIDAGIDAGVYTDFEGDPRPLGGGFDLGFDEFSSFVDYELIKTALPHRVLPGGVITYTLQFRNKGTILSSQTMLRDELPAELTALAFTSTLPITQTGSAPLTWLVGDLAPGAGGTITITAQLSITLAGGYTITNTANITTSQPVTVLHTADDWSSATVRVNAPPQTYRDEYTATQDSTLVVPAPGVLANDFDPDGDPLSASLITAPVSGALQLASTGGFVFTPTVGYTGTVSFTYRADDGLEFSFPTVVTITVLHVNHIPTALPDAYSTLEDNPLHVSAPGVLANDFDPDGDPLIATLVTQPASGNIYFETSGGFVYTPTTNTSGAITFTYAVNDGQALSATTQVTISIEAVNDPPQVEAGRDLALSEGSAAYFAGVFTDTGKLPGFPEEITWAFGDGATASGVLTPTHTYADDGVFTVTLTVTDSGGATGQDWLLVTVENAAPLVDAGENLTCTVNSIVTLTLTITDLGWLDEHTATILWGDGFSQTIELAAGMMTFQIGHAYTQTGSFSATFTVEDDDGGAGLDVVVVTVVEIEQPLLKIFLPLLFRGMQGGR